MPNVWAASSTVALRASTARMCRRSSSSSVKSPPNVGVLASGESICSGSASGSIVADGPQDDRPLHRVAQLADVAGPVIDPQDLLGGRRQIGDRPADGAGEKSQELPGQRQNVFRSIAQRRHDDFDHVQPIEQILAKPAVAHVGFQIAIRRRDDADVGCPGAGFADPLELLLLQEPQQFGLQGGRNLADFVEEQRAPFGRFDPAGLIAHRPGERALARGRTFRWPAALPTASGN